MRLRYWCLFILCLGMTLPGFAQDSTLTAQDSIVQTQPVVRNVVIWPYSETAFLIDSIGKTRPNIYWSSQNIFGLDISEVTFQNWNAGGSNSVSIMFNANIKRTYKRKDLRWQNELIARYGLNAQKGQKLRKTDDHLEFVSTLGFRTDSLSSWFYSAKVNFRTQFSKGFQYPDRSNAISKFMAPGYLFIGVGAEYGKDSDAFTLYISPATEKTTFVLDQQLANQGAFGVEPAVYDEHGNFIRPGKMINSEFGILVTSDYQVELFKDVHLSNRIVLYTDYLKNFGNIDVDWMVNFSFKVNDFIAAKIGSHLIYDDDIKTSTTNEAGEVVESGPKVQWKQQLGIGVVVSI